MKTTLLLVGLLALGALVPLAAAAPPAPPVYVCVDDVTHDACWRGGTACVGFSYQIPQCVYLDVVCAGSCTPCGEMISCDLPALQSGPEPMCMYYYYEIDTGIVRYVQRDSCHSEIYVNGQRVK